MFQSGDFEQGEDVIPVKTNGRYTYQGPPPGFELLGSSVFNLRDVSVVTFFVDDETSTLMGHYYDNSLGDPQFAGQARPVAGNIEDLEIQYFFNNDQANLGRTGETPFISSERLDIDQVRAVAVGLTAGSGLDTRSPRNQYRPGLFNRAPGTDPDSRRRASLAELVVLRNFQR
jgi:hypothetical protein